MKTDCTMLGKCATAISSDVEEGADDFVLDRRDWRTLWTVNRVTEFDRVCRNISVLLDQQHRKKKSNDPALVIHAILLNLILFIDLLNFYFYLFSVEHLRGEEGERPLDQETHQPLGVEDELVTAGLLVSAEGEKEQSKAGVGLWRRIQATRREQNIPGGRV